MVDLTAFELPVFGFSLAFQVLAAVLALRLVATSRGRLAWILIALALVLMAGRPTIALYDLVFLGTPLVIDPWAELGMLVISLLIAVGLLMMDTLVNNARNTEAAFQESDKRHRSLVELAPDAIIIHDGQKFVFANEAAARLHGAASPEDLIGRPWLDFIHPDERSGAVRRNATFEATGRIAPFITRRRLRMDGSEIMVETGAASVTWNGRSAIMGIFRDLAGRTEADNILRDSEERYRTLAEMSPDAVVVSVGDHIVYANDVAAKLHGAVSPDNLVGQNWLKLVHPDEIGDAVRIRTTISHESEPTAFYQRRRVRLDGAIVSVEVRVAGVIWNGEPARMAVLRDITERLKADEALRAREAQLRQIIDLAPVMIFVRDSNGCYLLGNEAVADFHGLNADDLYGLTVRQTHRGTIAWKRAMKSDKTVLDTGEALHIPKQSVMRHDGSEMIVETVKVPFMMLGGDEPAVLGVSVDITERVHALDALSESEARYRDLVAFSPDAILVQENGRIIFANPAGAELYGAASTDQLLGMEMKNLIHPDERDRHFLRRDALASTGKPLEITQQRRLRLDQTEILVETRGIQILWQGKSVVLGVSRDITARKQAEIRAQLREQELRQVQRLSSMGQLSTALAHELNQPLAAIVGYVQAGSRLLRAYPDGGAEKVIDLLEKAANQTDRAGKIIRRMRGFAERWELSCAPEDINEVVSEACEHAFLDTGVEGIDVKLDLAPQSKMSEIDRIQLQQVIVNLVRNAIEAMASSEIRELSIKTRDDLDGIFISVSDTGPGVDSEITNQLFEPFVTTKSKGMGFGLSVSRTIVEAHGGRIWAERNPGGITTFNIELPANLNKELEVDNAN